MFLEIGSVLRIGSKANSIYFLNDRSVEQRIAETPNKSIQRLAQETNLSFGIVQLILKKDLHFFSLSCVCCA
jgi:hypothetical protein